MRGRLKLDALLLAIVSVVLVELLPCAVRVLGRRRAILRRRGLLRIRGRGTRGHPASSSKRGDTVATTTARVAASWCQNTVCLGRALGGNNSREKKESQNEEDDDDPSKHPSAPVIPSRPVVTNTPVKTARIVISVVASTTKLSRADRRGLLEWRHRICFVVAPPPLAVGYRIALGSAQGMTRSLMVDVRSAMLGVQCFNLWIGWVVKGRSGN